MSADIVERLEAIASREDQVFGAMSNGLEIREAAAEIGRLRVELAVANECLGEERAANVLRTPAPAMPNGVEASPANCRERLRLEGRPYPRSGCAHCKLGGLTGCPYEKGAHNSGRAADNRDAAGVDHAPGFTFGVGGIAVSTGKYREEPAVFLRGVPERGVVGKPVEGTDLKAVMVFPTVEQMQRVADALVNAPAPAAVPAGEAVGGHHCDNCDGVAPETCFYNTTPPPAPVQATPQEGEQDTSRWPLLDRVEFALRDAGFDYDEAFRIAHMAAHPSACELGADTARLDWLEANCVDVADEYGTGSQLYFGTYATAPLRTAIDRALQHRGDSQEVGRG